jgi:hypothetical protein
MKVFHKSSPSLTSKLLISKFLGVFNNIIVSNERLSRYGCKIGSNLDRYDEIQYSPFSQLSCQPWLRPLAHHKGNSCHTIPFHYLQLFHCNYFISLHSLRLYDLQYLCLQRIGRPRKRNDFQAPPLTSGFGKILLYYLEYFAILVDKLQFTL